MPGVWIVSFALALAPGEGMPPCGPGAPSPHAAQSTEPTPATIARLSEAVPAALRRWTRPGDDVADQAAREFLVLYNALEQDKELSASLRQQLRTKVRARLAQLAEQIGNHLALQKPGPKPGDPPGAPARLAPVGRAQKNLAQMAFPPRRGAGRMRRGGMGPQAGFGGAGGAAAGFGAGATGGGAFQPRNPGPDDYGQQLVDLIRQTIAPSTWDVNGGPGSIYYWRPGRILAIRQTTEVHENVADFLQQLERLGR